jgi:hypothetical protein
VTKIELTGSLGVYADRLAADRELFATLSVEQLEELAGDSQALVDKATAMARAIRGDGPGAIPRGGPIFGAGGRDPFVGRADSSNRSQPTQMMVR